MSRGNPQPVQLPSGKWLARVGYTDPETAKRKEISDTAVHREDAVELMVMWRRMRDQGRLADHHKKLKRERITVNDVLDNYFKSNAYLSRDPSTQRNYSRYVDRWVRPKLGELGVSELTTGKAQSWVNNLIKAKHGMTAIRHAKSPLSMALKAAVKDELIDRNPLDGVTLEEMRNTLKTPEDQARYRNNGASKSETSPQATEIGVRKETDTGKEYKSNPDFDSEVRPFKFEELPKLKAAFEQSRERDIFRLLLGMGLRPSEAVALKWGDLKLDDRKMKISRSADDDGYLGPCKSKSARRVITIPKYLVAMLRTRRSDGANDDELVFPSRRGNVKKVSSLRDAFKRVLAIAELSLEYRLYDLRHTHASLLYDKKKIHPKAISKRLGHSSMAFTLHQYVWMSEAMDEECAEASDDLFE